LRAWISDEDTFDDTIFVSGFFVNALLAGGLVVLGEKLGLETGFDSERISAMLIAAAVVFGTRIFNNLAQLRRLLIERWRRSRAHRSELPAKGIPSDA
jgi:small basic protein